MYVFPPDIFNSPIINTDMYFLTPVENRNQSLVRLIYSVVKIGSLPNANKDRVLAQTAHLDQVSACNRRGLIRICLQWAGTSRIIQRSILDRATRGDKGEHRPLERQMSFLK